MALIRRAELQGMVYNPVPMDLEDVQRRAREIREQAEGSAPFYALHDSEGQRLALVRDRSAAFALARQNDLAPVTVH